jgi:hypothetical protein
MTEYAYTGPEFEDPSEWAHEEAHYDEERIASLEAYVAAQQQAELQALEDAAISDQLERVFKDTLAMDLTDEQARAIGDLSLQDRFRDEDGVPDVNAVLREYGDTLVPGFTEAVQTAYEQELAREDGGQAEQPVDEAAQGDPQAQGQEQDGNAPEEQKATPKLAEGEEPEDYINRVFQQDSAVAEEQAEPIKVDASSSTEEVADFIDQQYGSKPLFEERPEPADA